VKEVVARHNAAKDLAASLTDQWLTLSERVERAT
jgi:hypothetical protein